MLKDEQLQSQATPQGQPMTYGDYLRVPELLSLQTPLGVPEAHDETLFIIVQQAQELWFKQILHELHAVIEHLDRGQLPEAVRLLNRVNRIFGVLADEVDVLATMPPQDFQLFRHVLSPASGFESLQFRELELASGLSDSTFIKLIEKHMEINGLRSRWDKTLRDAFLAQLAPIARDPVEALLTIYMNSTEHSELYALAEALSEYETGFSTWRFHHIKLVERTIGDRVPGTAGSSGVGYLGKTMGYRFFPELLEVRNRISAQTSQ